MSKLIDLRLVHESLTFEEARRLKALAAAVEGFASARDKAAYVADVAPALADIGVRGVSLPSMYRKAEAYAAQGWRALLDGRVARRLQGAGGLGGNREFVEFWQGLALSNRRKTAPAYRELFRRLRLGESIPGLGDWRAIWEAEHGCAPAPDAPCPYHPYTDVPAGWTYRNLMRLMPTKYAVTAARQGTGAAVSACIPDVPRTRVGLAPCQFVQVDDMWHEVKVAFDGNHHAQRVMDLSCTDVLTAANVAWLCFPVRDDDEGRRETVRSEWMRYLFAHLLCAVGIPACGCTVMGERGTASASAELASAMAEVSGGLVRFAAGGLLTQPLGRGLYAARPKGNPRFKALLEGQHALIKNELGATMGHVGGGRGLQPEDAYGMDQEDERLRRMASALEKSRPGILGRLALPYMPWPDYWALARSVYEEADRRTWHNLEGWAECGFEVGEWRPNAETPWMPMESLRRMDARAAAAFNSLIASDKSLFRMRRMSPREAFASRAGELRRLDPVAATVVMGPGLARPCKCDDKLQLRYRDDTMMRRLVVAGVLDDGRLLERGKWYQVWHNPLDPASAYVADEGGRWLGTAPVQVAARYDDQAAIERHLGLRQKAIAAEARKMAPYVRRRQAEAAEAARRNALELLGTDPAGEAELGAAARREVASSDAADYLPPEEAAEEVADIGGDEAPEGVDVADVDIANLALTGN